MLRIALVAAASAALLAGCADHTDYNTYPDTQKPWHETRVGHEVDYEVLDQVLFHNDSADLSEHAGRVIAAIAAEAHRQGGTVVVDGYTDTTGTPEHNLELSRARADTVAAALSQEGIRDHAIQTHGFGETHLAVPTPDETVEPLNRRVVIRVIEG
jgi:outer membrane protein OmpA-like peptidoglycan-associated protein